MTEPHDITCPVCDGFEPACDFHETEGVFMPDGSEVRCCSEVCAYALYVAEIQKLLTLAIVNAPQEDGMFHHSLDKLREYVAKPQEWC